MEEGASITSVGKDQHAKSPTGGETGADPRGFGALRNPRGSHTSSLELKLLSSPHAAHMSIL